MNQPRNVTTTVAVTKSQQTYDTIVATLKQNNGADAKAIRAMLGGDRALMDRFLATTFALLARNSTVLRDCTPASIVQSIKDAASLGLEPETQDGSIVPMGAEAVFMPSWQGHLKRIRNSGKVADVDVALVHEKDDWSWWMDSDKGFCFIHKPSMDTDRGSYRGAYAYAIMPTGYRIGTWMPEAEIIEIRDRFSRGASRADSPWRTRPGEMYKKTVLNNLQKRLPQSAVDQLLLRDPDSTLERSVTEQLEPVRDELASLRELAMGRVADAPPANGDAAATKTVSETQPASGACDGISPELGPCGKPAGHDGAHGNENGRWPR